MEAADEMLRRYGHEILPVALRATRGVRLPATLYRGILLEPNEVKSDKVERDPRLTFVSFSEDREVACWFADTRSIMSGYVKETRPHVDGYLIEYAPSQNQVLFSATGQPELCKLLCTAAEMHPHIDASQLRWNVMTQKEVILKQAPSYVVLPYKCDREETQRLDAKFTHPLFR
jgi:hypothetical protein